MVRWIMDCPECGGQMSVMSYGDDCYRYEGDCSECEKVFDIRIGKGESK